jgi:hypothetical protein
VVRLVDRWRCNPFASRYQRVTDAKLIHRLAMAESIRSYDGLPLWLRSW